MTSEDTAMKIVKTIMALFIGVMLFASIAGANNEVKRDKLADLFCQDNGWDNALERGPINKERYCYRYIDGFYEESPKLDWEVYSIREVME